MIKMRNYLLLFLLLFSINAFAQQRQISYIDNAGSWYHVYDTNGKKITTLSCSAEGELIGWSGRLLSRSREDGTRSSIRRVRP